MLEPPERRARQDGAGSCDGSAAAGWANLVPASAMAACWLLPMVLFWGAAFGPLRPRGASRADAAPRPLAFLLGAAASLSPCALPRAYYHPRAGVRARRWLVAIGVRGFRRFVADGDLVNRWARRHDPGYRVLAGRAERERFLQSTCALEQAHLVLLLMGLFSVCYAARVGWYRWAVGLAIGNVVGNVYPILLQRYNRGRIASTMRERPGR